MSNSPSKKKRVSEPPSETEAPSDERAPETDSEGVYFIDVATFEWRPTPAKECSDRSGQKKSQSGENPENRAARSLPIEGRHGARGK